MIDKRTSNSEEESDNITNDVISQTSTTSSSSSPSTVVDIEIQDIEGVGPTTAEEAQRSRYCFCNGPCCNKC